VTVPAWLVMATALLAPAADGPAKATSVGTEPVAAAVVPAQPVSLSPLQWLAGCWRRTTTTGVVEEQWMAPAGGIMLGMSRTVGAADGKLIEFEQVRIEARGDSAVYVAHPSRQETAEFAAIAFDDSLIVFENRAHDFPQRIGYRRVGPDSLAAWIEGPGRDGKTRRVDFPYRRAACPDGRP
jgi:hypothetical protein